MPATDVFETEIADLLFLNLAFDNIGDATGLVASTGAGNMEISLHTGTLTDSSSQNTTEAAYTSYARVDVARAGADWTNTVGVVTNDNIIAFPAATGGSETETDVGLGSDIAANELWFYGALTASLAVSNGITPQFAASALQITFT